MVLHEDRNEPKKGKWGEVPGLTVPRCCLFPLPNIRLTYIVMAPVSISIHGVTHSIDVLWTLQACNKHKKLCSYEDHTVPFNIKVVYLYIFRHIPVFVVSRFDLCSLDNRAISTTPRWCVVR